MPSQRLQSVHRRIYVDVMTSSSTPSTVHGDAHSAAAQERDALRTAIAHADGGLDEALGHIAALAELGTPPEASLITAADCQALARRVLSYLLELQNALAETSTQSPQREPSDLDDVRRAVLLEIAGAVDEGLTAATISQRLRSAGLDVRSAQVTGACRYLFNAGLVWSTMPQHERNRRWAPSPGLFIAVTLLLPVAGVVQ